MFPLKITRIRTLAAAGTLAVLAGCATPPPPPPPPPPPIVIPPMPLPPMGAALAMNIPVEDQYGLRRTPNYRLTSVQTTWNLRSALNVAALNCLQPEHESILPAYKSLLERNEKKLAKTNTDLAGAFRAIYGSTYRDVMDDYLTQVYNYFALPPVNRKFCDVTQEILTESLTVQPEELDAFAARSMPKIEAVFEEFFRAYEAYLDALRKWNSMYGTPIVTVYAAPPPFTNPLAPEFDMAPPPAGTVTALPTIPGTAGDQATVVLPGITPVGPAAPVVVAPSSGDAAPTGYAPVPMDPTAPVSGPAVQSIPEADPIAGPTTGAIVVPQTVPADDGN